MTTAAPLLEELEKDGVPEEDRVEIAKDPSAVTRLEVDPLEGTDPVYPLLLTATTNIEVRPQQFIEEVKLVLAQTKGFHPNLTHIYSISIMKMRSDVQWRIQTIGNVGNADWSELLSGYILHRLLYTNEDVRDKVVDAIAACALKVDISIRRSNHDVSEHKYVSIVTE